MKTIINLGTRIFLAAALTASAAELGGLSSSAAKGSSERAIVPLTSLEAYLPQLIIGGEWSATIKLTLLGTVPLRTSTARFYDNTGAPLRATFTTSAGNTVTDVGFSLTNLRPGQVVEATFTGTANTAYGHAVIDPSDCDNRDCYLYAEVTLKNSNASRPDFESVFALELANDTHNMFWDFRGGALSTLYLVNVNTTETTVTVTYHDIAGTQLGKKDYVMKARESLLTLPHAEFPNVLLGKQGLVRVEAKNPGTVIPQILVSALRITASNSFTPIRTFTGTDYLRGPKIP